MGQTTMRLLLTLRLFGLVVTQALFVGGLVSCDASREKRVEQRLLESTPTANIPSQVSDELGWTLPVADVADEALMQYEQGLKARSSGDARAAVNHFAASLQLAPGFDAATFQYAIALALIQDDQGAIQQIQGLLRRDLPGYFEKVSVEPAFSGLLAATDSFALAAGLGQQKVRWEAAFDQGWPLIWFRKTSSPPSPEPQEFYDKHLFRAGVYLPNNQRFLPTGLVIENALAAWSEPNMRQVLTVSADATVDLFSSLYKAKWQRQPWVVTNSNQLQDASADDPHEYFGAMDFSFRTGELQLSTLQDLDDLAPTPNDKHVGNVLRVLGEGSIVLSRQVQYPLSGRTLRLSSSRTVSLSDEHERAQHQSVVAYDKGVFVVSSQHRCTYDDPAEAVPVQSHVIDFVNIENGSIRPVSQGPGVASVVVMPDGAALLQIAERLFELTAKGEDWALRALPDGVLLHVPLLSKHCIYH